MPNQIRSKNKALQELAELRARLRVVEEEVKRMRTGKGAAAPEPSPSMWKAGIGHERAEAALRESEERYLALFNAIEQGFCTIEVLFDEQDRPLDYRFLEVSPSFERQTGIPNAAGRWMPRHRAGSGRALV
jgi:PAS domain-containing protein